MEKRKRICNKKKSHFILVGSLLILFGISIVGSKYLYNHIEMENEQELLDTFYDVQKEISDKKVEKKDSDSTSPTSEIKTDQPKTNYIAALRIPKIGLEKGLCAKGTSCNNVNKNIQILKDSDYPDVENGNFMLAAHSGSGKTAFFKELVNLELNDEVSVYYDGNLYTYKVINTYDIEKTGKANIVRNSEKTTLTLITCRPKTNKQIIFICELIEKV